MVGTVFNWGGDRNTTCRQVVRTPQIHLFITFSNIYTHQVRSRWTNDAVRLAHISILRIRSSTVYPLIFKSFWSIETTIFDTRFYFKIFTDPVSVMSVTKTGATFTSKHVFHLTLDVTSIAIANITIVAVFP